MPTTTIKAISDAYRLIENASDENIISIDSNTNVQAILKRTISKAERILRLTRKRAKRSRQQSPQSLGSLRQLSRRVSQKQTPEAQLSSPLTTARLSDPAPFEQPLSVSTDTDTILSNLELTTSDRRSHKTVSVSSIDKLVLSYILADC